ncbi:MAG: lamin tail domain-containing protein [Candidatus Pacebacteria bacterium]|nr:lamin tail domain-containing protein [Candidatus Paceibacterota bacterium]
MLFKKTLGSFLALLFLGGSFFVLGRIILAQTENNGDDNVGKVLISEIMTGGEQAGDEFIELYNPSESVVSLEGWLLKKKTKAGVTEYNLLSDVGTKVDPLMGYRDDSDVSLEILPGGYFLIAPRYSCGAGENERCYLGEVEPDNFYSVKGLFIADDNSIALYDGEKVLVDQVGWGKVAASVGDVFVENIPVGKSLARRIIEGKMQDTGDISRDFLIQDLPNPCNSKSLMGAGGDVESEKNEEVSGSAGEAAEETETDEEIEVVDNGIEENLSDENLPDSSLPADTSGDSSVVVAEEEKKIIISEIMISPVGDDAKLEFIEIYNTGTGTADLGGWSLEDQAGRTGKYIFPSGIKINPEEYRAFYSNQTKLSLNNMGDGAALKDAAGDLIFKTPLSDEAKEGVSFASENNSWFWTSVSTPGGKNIIKEKEAEEKQSIKISEAAEEIITMSESEVEIINDDVADVENIDIDESYDFSDGVIINEIFPDPVGRDNQGNSFEWVELFNENARSVNLRGWCLDDILEKGSKIFCFSSDRIIAAKSFLVVSSSETKIAFNNSDEEVNLLWPDKRVVDSASYQQAKEGFSYSLSADGSWIWINKITPSAVNAKLPSVVNKTASSVNYSLASITARSEEAVGKVLSTATLTEEQYATATIAEAKTLLSGSAVQLSGLVSVPRGILGKDVLYILDKDSGEGVQMFGVGDDLSVLLLGDEVKISGQLGEVGGEKRLLAETGSAEKISGDNMLEIFALDFADLEGGLGGLVEVEGEVIDIAGDNILYLKTADGELKVYAEPETGISFADIKSGEKVAIIGIFSRTSLGYRLLPRFKSDIRFLESENGGIISRSEGGAVKNGGLTLFFGLAFGLAISIIIFRRYFNRAGNKKIA